MSKHTTFPNCDFNPKQHLQSDKFGIASLWGYPLEITSGAIDPSGVHEYLFSLQANTSQGLWNLHAIPQSHVEADEFCELLQDLERRHRTPPFRWATRRPTIVARTHVAIPEVSLATSTASEPCVVDDESVLDDWRSSPSEILARLLAPSTDGDELLDAVLFAEIATFDASQTEQLLPRLFAFVAEYRLSQEDAVRTAVGAAIRKLAMNLPDSQIQEYADLFLPTDTDTLPCEIELELAKAIVWRLMTSSASLSLPFPELESCLGELASDYLKPRLVLQENYASVAIQAALGVLLLNGPHAKSVLQSVKDIGIGWFTELFQRRLGKLRRQLAETEDRTFAAVVTNLGRFESEFKAASDQDDTKACQLGD